MPEAQAWLTPRTVCGRSVTRRDSKQCSTKIGGFHGAAGRSNQLHSHRACHELHDRSGCRGQRVGVAQILGRYAVDSNRQRGRKKGCNAGGNLRRCAERLAIVKNLDLTRRSGVAVGRDGDRERYSGAKTHVQIGRGDGGRGGDLPASAAAASSSPTRAYTG